MARTSVYHWPDSSLVGRRFIDIQAWPLTAGCYKSLFRGRASLETIPRGEGLSLGHLPDAEAIYLIRKLSRYNIHVLGSLQTVYSWPF